MLAVSWRKLEKIFVKMRNENRMHKDLQSLSVSSTEFWNNEIDDEVWNNA